MEEKILLILKDVNEDILSYTGNNMMADGVIDSFELIEIVGRLEEDFDMEIDGEYVVAQNFGNKESIISLMEKLLSKTGGAE